MEEVHLIWNHDQDGDGDQDGLSQDSSTDSVSNSVLCFDAFARFMDSCGVIVAAALVVASAVSSVLGLPIQGWEATTRLVLGLLGACYAIAFASAARQAHGLIGQHGILPVAGWGLPAIQTAQKVARESGEITRYTVLAAFFLAGLEFTALQWDSLLLEAGFWAAPLAAMQGHGLSCLVILAVFRLMALKLMWLSGLCKLATGDRHWLSATAMDFHFLTQPLPSPTAAYAHSMMLRCHCLRWFCSFFAVAGELGAPVLALLPFWWARVVAVATLGGLLLGMAATGNYGSFHLLTLAVLASLMGDDLLPWVPAPRAVAPGDAWEIALAVAGVVLAVSYFAVNFAVLSEGWPQAQFAPEASATSWCCGSLRSLGAAQHYGLFGKMSTRRSEVVVFELHKDVDGGAGHGDWIEVTLPYKPGPVDRTPPRLPTLHMPRLDWLLWLVAIRVSCEESLQLQQQLGVRPIDAAHEWFREFLKKLEQREPGVLSLLSSDEEQKGWLKQRPLATHVAVFEYDFATCSPEHPGWEEGVWWRRRHLMDVTS